VSKYTDTLGGDRRGISTVLGFVLIFGILVVSFSAYQAEVVPEQNEEVEFEHYQEVREQMTELRSNFVLMSESTSTRAVSVDLAARYPSRAIFVNPPPATGELRTVGTEHDGVNVTIENAVAVDGETADFWNGDNVTYDTGTIEYDPDYNRQRGTPPLVYEHTLLHNNVENGGQSVSLTEQSLVSDNRIKLITVDGSFRETSVGTESVDLEPVSTRSRVVGVENRSGPITVEFASRMNVSTWEESLANEMRTGHVDDISFLRDGPDGFSILELVLEPDQRYQLELAKVGVGTGVTDTGESYITTVEGEDTSVRTNTTQQITVEVRDKFNNPQSGVNVTASASVGELRPSGEDGSFADTADASTRSNGRVTFLYQAAQSGSHRVNLTFSNTSGNVAGLSNETYVKPNITVVGSSSNDNDSPDGGTTGNPALESGQTIVYESKNGTLMSLNGSGGERQTVGSGITDATVLGAPGDLTGDGETVLPYVDTDRNLKTVNRSGDITELVSGTGSGKSKAPNKNTPSLVGTGTWNGDSSVLYATQNNRIYQADPSGTSTEVGKFNKLKLVGVLGVGDIDSDGKDELLFTGTDNGNNNGGNNGNNNNGNNGNNNNGNNDNIVSYIESNGGNPTKLTGDLGSGTAAGQPIEISGSTYVPIVDDDGDVELHTDDDDADNEEVEIELDSPDVTNDLPITSADVDDDGGIEIVYINSSNILQYIDEPLEDSPESKTLEDSDGKTIETDGDIGVVSS
jgi:hypothetical protein